MRILIVEDDRKLARQIKKGLDEQGHSVITASDGAEGLDVAKYGEFDVLVLDVMLPGLDGFSIRSAAPRRRKRRPDPAADRSGRG